MVGEVWMDLEKIGGVARSTGFFCKIVENRGEANLRDAIVGSVNMLCGQGRRGLLKASGME